VDAARGQPLWDDGLREQIYLGDDDFVARMLALAEPSRAGAIEVLRAQRRGVSPGLQQWLQHGPTRDQAIWRADRESGLPMTAIAAELGLSISRVSRVIAREELTARDDKVAKVKT